MIEEINKIPKLWQLTEKLSDKILRHNRLGKFYRHKTTGYWRVKDAAEHAGSKFKV